MFESTRESSESEESSTSTTSLSSKVAATGPRVLTLGVKGGWQMGFHFSGVAVPVDFDQEPEKQMLKERTLFEMMRCGRGGGGLDGGEA